MSSTGSLHLVTVSRPHGLIQRWARRIATGPAGLDDERPDIAAQHESASVASGLDLLVMATIVVAILGIIEAPRALSDRARTGLPPRILVPPPRWTALA